MSDVDPSWIELSPETMNKLQANAARNPSPPLFDVRGSVGGHFGGNPVHRVGDKWYVDIQPLTGGNVENMIKVMEVLDALTPGTCVWNADRDSLQIYDGAEWMTVTGAQMTALGVSPNQAIRELQGQQTISPESLREIREWVEEQEAEAERLRLRDELLAAQEEDDDGDG